MWTRRLAAVAVAIALVIGALVARDRIDGSRATRGTPTGGTTPGSSGSDTTAGTPATLTLVCIPELEQACNAAMQAVTKPTLTVRVEAAGTTRDALANADDPSSVLSAWVTLSPWAELTDAARSRATSPRPTAFGTSTPLGRSPVAMAVKANRYDALAVACKGPVTWTCVGDNAGKAWSSIGGQASWQALYPAHADPTTSASGLVALAGIVVQRLGRSDFVGSDLDGADPAFDTWMSTLETAIPHAAFDANQGTPLQQLLAEPRYSVVATTEAEIRTIPANRATEVKQVLPAPTPTSVAEAVVVPATGVTLPGNVLTALAEAVQARGWNPSGADPTNVPTPTTMEALQQLWQRLR